MTDSCPSPLELLQVVSDCLNNDIAPALDDKSLQFKLKIAANVLAIVGREIALLPESSERDRAQLATLLGEDGTLAQLAQRMNAAIAAGEFDGRDDELLAGLQAICLRQVAVDNPKYSTYQVLIKDTRVL